MSAGHFMFQMVLLYTLAGGCFLAALFLLIFGARGLFKLLNGGGVG
jgi:hypothetical protein